MSTQEELTPATPGPGGSRRLFGVVGFITALGVLLSILLFLVARDSSRSAIRDEFTARAEERMTSVEDSIIEHLDVLYATSAFFDASNVVDREEFRAFTTTLLTRHSGVQALEWAPRVTHDQRAALEQSARDDGLEGFRFMDRGPDGNFIPSTRRDEYYPELYVEPIRGNERALGFDLASNAQRREAIERAAETGDIVASSRIRLVQETRDEHAFLVFLPKYAKGASIETAQDRSEHIAGFVLGVFRAGDVIEAAVSRLEPMGIDLWLTDESSPPEERLLASHRGLGRADEGALESSAPNARPLQAHRALEVGGHTWRITCAPTPAFLAARASLVPWCLLGVGLVITALLAAYIHRASGETTRAQQAVRSRTAELSRSNEALARQVAASKLLHRTAALSAEAKSVERILGECVDMICEMRGWPVGHVYVPASDDSGELEASDIWHLDDPMAYAVFKELTQRTRFAPGSGLPGRVLVSGRPAWIANVQEDENFPRARGTHDIRVKGAFAFPVIIEGETIAVAEFFSDEVMEPDEDLLELMRSVGTQIARVAERIRAVEALRSGEARLQAVVSSVIDGIITIDHTGTVKSFNEAAQELFGYAPAEVIGRNVKMLMPEPYCSEHDEYLARFQRTGEAKVIGVGREVVGLRKDGSTFPMELAVSVMPSSSRPMFVGVTRNITDRKLAEEEMRSRNEQLDAALQAAKHASRAKSEFLAGMSHELRTPLNAIIGFTDGLLDRVDKHPLTDHQKNRLTRVKMAGQHLLSLINDILDLAKVEAGEMTANATTFDATELADEVGDLAEALLGDRRDRVRFECKVVESVPALTSDRDKIKQILLNLLSNAAKFTDEGRVTLLVQTEGERVHFAVEDTGRGIPSDQIHRVFDKFHQVGGSHVEGGTGLGLALCREFADLLGAVLRVRSIEGEGSTFTLSVPACFDRKEAETVDKLKEQIVAEAEVTSASAARRLVLCVEDNADNMLLLKDYLTDAGCHVIPLFNAEEAERVAEERRPDLVVLDVMMPGLDGWEVLRRLKANPATRNLPVILATAIEGEDLGLSLGASDYITKPIDKARLLDSINSLGETGGAKSRVAVVDDDPAVRDVLTDLLEDRGYSVRTFENGRHFLDALPDWVPDMLLLDLMMPEVDGFAVVEAMQADPRWRDIPTVILTAMILSSEQLLQLNRRVQLVLEKDGLNRSTTMKDIVSFLETSANRRAAA